MSSFLLKKESESILKQMDWNKDTSLLLCPILKVLHMRHASLDTLEVKRIVKEVLVMK